MQVLEHTLQVTGDALISGDFDAFASIFDLPHNITTFEGNVVLKTPQDLRQTFDSIRNQFRQNRITSIVRQCISAQFDGAKRIKATHTTRLLAGAQQIGETSMGYSILTLKSGRWLGVASQYAVAEEHMSRAIIVSSKTAHTPEASSNTNGNLTSLADYQRKRST